MEMQEIGFLHLLRICWEFAQVRALRKYQILNTWLGDIVGSGIESSDQPAKPYIGWRVGYISLTGTNNLATGKNHM